MPVRAGNMSAVDINWHLFRGVFSAVDSGQLTTVKSGPRALDWHVNPILKALLTIYIMTIGIQMAIAPSRVTD